MESCRRWPSNHVESGFKVCVIMIIFAICMLLMFMSEYNLILRW